MRWQDWVFLIIAVLALSVALYEAFAGRKSRKNAGAAIVVTERFTTYENVNSPAGRQSSV